MELRHSSFGAVSSGQKQETDLKQNKLNDLQSLIELGCVKDSIKLGDFEFQLKTLNASERLSLSSLKIENDEDMFNLNIKLLSLSIESVNGKPIETYHPKYSTSEHIYMLREEIIASFQASVISSLVNFYSQLSGRSDVQFDSAEIKK